MRTFRDLQTSKVLVLNTMGTNIEPCGHLHYRCNRRYDKASLTIMLGGKIKFILHFTKIAGSSVLIDMYGKNFIPRHQKR